MSDFCRSCRDEEEVESIQHFLCECPGLARRRFDTLGENFFSGLEKKLEEQVDLGRTKSIGISNFNKKQVSKLIANSRIKPASNQIELHAYMQQPELVKYCQDNGIVVVSFSSLGNPGVNEYLAKQGAAPRLGAGDVLLDPVVKQIAEKHKKTPAHVLLTFWLQKKVAVIPKSVTPKRIKDNFDLFDFTLDNDDITSIERLNRGPVARLSKLDFSLAFTNHPEYPYKNKT